MVRSLRKQMGISAQPEQQRNEQQDPVQQQIMLQQQLQQQLKLAVKDYQVIHSTETPPKLNHLGWRSVQNFSVEYKLYLQKGNTPHPRDAIDLATQDLIQLAWKTALDGGARLPAIDNEPAMNPNEWLDTIVTIFAIAEGVQHRGTPTRIIQLERNKQEGLLMNDYMKSILQMKRDNSTMTDSNLCTMVTSGVQKEYPELYGELKAMISSRRELGETVHFEALCQTAISRSNDYNMYTKQWMNY